MVAFFCATYLKPEMHHVHRQILAGPGWRPVVVAQKIENRATFPVDALELVPRSPGRFLARARERHFGGAPWQITRGEAARIQATLRRHEARVLHVFFGNVAVHLLPLLRRLEIPFVVSFHGADVTGAIATASYRAACEEVFDRAARVVARSEALAVGVRALGCPEEKLGVIRTALPDIEFVPRVLPADGAIRLVQAGRLVPKKGFGTSLAAVAALAPKFRRLTLTIAGTGPLEDDLRARAQALGVGDRVEFAGFLSQAELRARVAAAHVFLHPSETVAGDVEGVPNALLEAAATGLPVVATRHGGIPEAITDGAGGLLCAEGDVAGVSAAIERLVTDPALHARIAAGGAAEVRAKFGREIVAAQLDALYRGVAEI